MPAISKYSYQIINNLCHLKESVVSKNSLLKMSVLSKKDRIMLSSEFIHRELPIRFVKRIKDLEHLPLQLDASHEIFQIRDNFIQSLHDITSTSKPTTITECENFKEIVDTIHARHSNTLTTMAKGIKKLKESHDIDENDAVDDFLSRFYRNRTKTRLLIDNYLSYYNDDKENVGIFNLECNLESIMGEVIGDIERMAEIHRHKHPNITADLPSIKFVYASSYLYYPLLEIMKNSLVAVRDTKDPRISITSYYDNNIILLKISDNGKGIEEKNLENIWKYSFTTTVINHDQTYLNDFESNNPLSGFGYGLPISRVLLRTFNGDICVFSEKDIGTDVYLYINLNSNWLL